MKAHLLRSALPLCLAATSLAVLAQGHPYRDPAIEQQRYESARAKDIAAAEVGGEPLGARLIDLNGATGGWEVLVRVSAEERWRVIVDRDTWTVRRKEKVEKP
ncbi:MAG TPA: hypothetical protein VJ483_00445 [Holophagaceae bacterium]|nr:hypothetical protein [Holophagaceae bacterium]